MARRREFPRKVRAQIISRAMNKDGRVICEGCGLVLGLKRYEIDHTVPEGLRDGATREPLTADDGRLLGLDCCHRAKTRGDVRAIRKSDRQRDKHSGAYQSRSPMPGGRRSKWKRKISGEVVER